MGHEIKYLSFPVSMSKEKILSAADVVARANSDCHSGLPSFIRWYDVCLGSHDEAVKFNEDRDTASYAQIAVRYRETNNIVPSKTLLSLSRKVKEARQRYDKLNYMPHFKNASSQLISCKKWGLRN